MNSPYIHISIKAAIPQKMAATYGSCNNKHIITNN